MISGPKPVPDTSETESPYQYHIDFLREITDSAISNDTRKLEHPSIVGTLIFIRTTIREKELGHVEFAPLYEAAKQAIQEHLGIDYLRDWIEKIAMVEAQYAKKKPDPIDSSTQRKTSSDEARDELSAYFNDIWKRTTATSFESVEKLNLADLNEDEFCTQVVRSEPFSYGKHKEENASIDLKTSIKKILKFIKKENPDLHARLETKVDNRIGEIKRRIADTDPSKLDARR
jgi:ATP-dependent Lon protease